jgi:hypothetical protein
MFWVSGGRCVDEFGQGDWQQIEKQVGLFFSLGIV